MVKIATENNEKFAKVSIKQRSRRARLAAQGRTSSFPRSRGPHDSDSDFNVFITLHMKANFWRSSISVIIFRTKIALQLGLFLSSLIL